MAKRLDCVSPLLLPECIHRLEILSKQPALSVVERGKITRIFVSRFINEFTSDDLLYFQLSARVHDYTYRRMGGLVFLRTIGRLDRSDDVTRVRIDIRLGPPVTTMEWLAQIAWYVIFTGILLGYLVGAIHTADERLWKLTGGFAILYGLMYIILVRIYIQASFALASVLKKVLELAPLQENIE